jgi:hypothetical protein
MGAPPSGSGCQPTASAADASSQSGIPNAEWLPIETAPEFKVVAVAVYQMPFGLWHAFGAAQLVEGRWLHCLGDIIDAPTHWLPLPYGPCDEEAPLREQSERTEDFEESSGCVYFDLSIKCRKSQCALCRPASGMSASGQDPQGLEAKPASPTSEAGDAQ